VLRIAVLVHVAATTACVIPLGLPPTRTDIGHTWQRNGTGTRIAVGFELGSIIPAKDAPVEAGAGFVFDMLSSADDPMGSTVSGQYVDGGVVVRRTEHSRLIAGARYEHYKSGTFENAAKLRVDLEAVTHVHSNFAGADGTGGVIGGGYGNFGLGLYAEGGPAWTVDQTHGWVATLGVSVRMPGWLAVIWGLPSGHSGGGHSSHGWSGSSGSSSR
jgi:hypothetical protein